MPPPTKHVALVGWLLTLTAAGLFYGPSAARTIQWQDSGYHVLRVVEREPVNPMGLALSHPLHHWLGRALAAVLPVEPAHSLSLLSALAGAVAVANVFGVVRELTGRTPAAALAAAGLLVAHTFWKLSTIPETYSLAAALLTAEMWALARFSRTRRPGWLVAAFLASGLGLANHNLALLTLPVTGTILLAALWRREARPAWLPACGVAWALGAAPLLALVVARASATGDVAETIRSALFGTYQPNVMGRGLNLRLTAISLAFTLLSFPNLTLPAAVLGLARGDRARVPPLMRRALPAALLLHLGFVLRYNVVDQYMFLAPAYALIAVTAGAGYAAVLQRWPRPKTLAAAAGCVTLLTLGLYAVVPEVARQGNVLMGVARGKPYRDDYAYLFDPRGSAQTSAGQMASDAIALAGPGGVIVAADEMGLYAVRYASLADRGVAGATVVRDLGDFHVRHAIEEGRYVVYVPARRGDASPPLPLPPGPLTTTTTKASTLAWRRAGELFVLGGVAIPVAPARPE